MSSLPTFAFLMLAALGSLGAIMAVLGVLWASGRSGKRRQTQGAKLAASLQSETDLAH